MPNRPVSSNSVAASLAVAFVFALLPAMAMPEISNEQSRMSAEEFLSLARQHVPQPELEYGIDYEYLVVEGTVEDLRFEAPPEGARDFGVRAYCVALIDVHAMEGVPAISGQWSVLELTLVHPPFYNADGLAGHRAPADGRALFDRLQVGDSIVAVGVKTNDPTLRRVSFSDDDRFANVFSVVRRGDSDESPVAIVGGERSLVTDWRRRGEPWTLVEPSLIEREFVHVGLSISEVFVRLVNVVKERRKP